MKIKMKNKPDFSIDNVVETSNPVYFPALKEGISTAYGSLINFEQEYLPLIGGSVLVSGFLGYAFSSIQGSDYETNTSLGLAVATATTSAIMLGNAAINGVNSFRDYLKNNTNL